MFVRIYQPIKNCQTCRLRNICYHMYSVASSYVGIYVRRNQRTVAKNKSPKTRTYSTKVGPVENQWCYNGYIQSLPLSHVPVMFTCQSNDPSYTGLTIWLNLIHIICTELVEVFLVNFFFHLFLGTRFNQKLHTIMTLVLLENHWIRKQEILRLSAFYFISLNIMVGFKVKARTPARTSAYFTKLGWRSGCVFVGGIGCVYVWRDG